MVMKAYSGADVNIMEKHHFKSFLHRTNDKHTSTNNTVKLLTLKHKIEVEGEFQTVIHDRTRGKATTCVVASKGIHSPLLISKEALKELGMSKIQPHGCFTEPNGLAIFKEECSANKRKVFET